MNIVSKLTLQYLKKNRSRTLVTIIGVAISVAMVAATFSIGSSFMDMMYRNAAVQSGDWHAVFMGVNGVAIDTITHNEQVHDSVVSKRIGFAKLPESAHGSKSYLYIAANSGFELTPLRLTEGRFPATEDELIISTQLLKNSGLPWHIGDTVTLNLGTRMAVQDGVLVPVDDHTYFGEEEQFQQLEEKTYTITGIADDRYEEYRFAGAYPVYSGLDLAQISQDESYTVQVRYAPLSAKIYDTTAALAEETYCDTVEFNNQLLLYAGVSSDKYLLNTLLMATVIVGLLISVGSVSLIYNAFAISLSERIRTLGMLASVGATKKQKRFSVFFEALAIGIVAVPLGLLVGYAGISITFGLLSPLLMNALGITAPFRLVIAPTGFVGTILFSVLILYISAWIPARRASGISPIDAIRQSKEITVHKKDVKTVKSTRRFLGFEAELGLKSLKRNRHRYYATLFSLIISIVLFLTASAFASFLKETFSSVQNTVPYDLAADVWAENGDETALQSMLSDLKQVQNAASVITTRTLYSVASLAPDMVTGDITSRVDAQDGIYPTSFNIVSLDDASLRDYAQKAGISFEALQAEPCGILVNRFTLKEDHVFTDIDQLTLTQGASIPYKIGLTETEEFKGEVKIAGITDVIPPFRGSYRESVRTIDMVVSEKAMRQLLPKDDSHKEAWDPNIKMLYTTANADALQNEIETLKDKHPEMMKNIFNVAASRQHQQQMTLIVSTFLYGFVALIGIISVANIINTITTGLSLRTREFAMLRSFGMTPAGFKRMIRFESLFYGIKALLYGLPLGAVVASLIYMVLQRNFALNFAIPWPNIAICILFVALTVGGTMLYSAKKARGKSIVETLQNENL